MYFVIFTKKKADAIKTQIGYPENIFNQTYMNKHYDVIIIFYFFIAY